jgi:hypothetical protein
LPIQSSVDRAKRDVATSTILFTRMIGQSIAAAVFGGILNARRSGQLASGGDIVDKLMEPMLRQSLSAAEREFVRIRHRVGMSKTSANFGGVLSAPDRPPRFHCTVSIIRIRVRPTCEPDHMPESRSPIKIA